MNLAFVGTAVSEELCTLLPAASVAGNNMQLGIIRGLENATGESVHTLSVTPRAMFPRSGTIISQGGESQLHRKTVAHLVPFANLLGLKQLTIFLVLFSRLVLWLLRARGDRLVIVYNLMSPFSLAVLLATGLCGGRAVAVVADLPCDLEPNRKWLLRFLDRTDERVQLWAIRRFSALIPLTPYLALDFAPHLPALVVEGGIEVVGWEPDGPAGSEEQVIMFSGALTTVNGVDLLLYAFNMVQLPNARLHIFGKGPLEQQVRQAALGDPRIIYGGILSNQDIRKRQARATVLVNPRPTSNNITRYTFPSKLLEYMASGRPVMTTRLAGIPEEYYSFLFLFEQETPLAIAAAIESVCQREELELSKMGRAARRFVLERKSWKRQGERIFLFLSDLTKR